MLTDHLKSMKRVLRRLAFTDKDDLVLTKGKMACIISACDEVLLTEFIFSGLLNKLSPARIASFLSCVVFDENLKNKKIMEIPDQELRKALDHAQRITKSVFEVYVDSKIEGIEEEDFAECLNPKLVMATY